MDVVTGFNDRFGQELRIRRFLSNNFSQCAEKFGYEPLAVALVENAEAYDEKVVGASPWPEWDSRGCFYFNIRNYQDSYSDEPETRDVLLIPEGTVSVTRWLGNRLSKEDPNVVQNLGIKVYYDLDCFRNEVVSSLNAGKRRQFSQFGIEILGADSVASDIEPLLVARNTLTTIGVPQNSVVFRLSTNRMFLELANLTTLSESDKVIVKEGLDTIAECKAGKGASRYETQVQELTSFLSSKTTDEKVLAAWDYIIHREVKPIVDEDYERLSILSSSNLDYLRDVESSLMKHSINVEIDLCVVRSHEYYTGFTFEIDLIGDQGERYVEVGGGGRYDRLLSNFVPDNFPSVIPSTGFAFGVERLMDSLKKAGYLNINSHAMSEFYDFSEEGHVEKINLIQQDNIEESCNEYLDTVDGLLNKQNEQGRFTVVGNVRS